MELPTGIFHNTGQQDLEGTVTLRPRSALSPISQRVRKIPAVSFFPQPLFAERTILKGRKKNTLLCKQNGK